MAKSRRKQPSTTKLIRFEFKVDMEEHADALAAFLAEIQRSGQSKAAILRTLWLATYSPSFLPSQETIGQLYLGRRMSQMAATGQMPLLAPAPAPLQHTDSDAKKLDQKQEEDVDPDMLARLDDDDED